MQQFDILNTIHPLTLEESYSMSCQPLKRRNIIIQTMVTKGYVTSYGHIKNQKNKMTDILLIFTWLCRFSYDAFK